MPEAKVINEVDVIEATAHPLAVPPEIAPPAIDYRSPEEVLAEGVRQAKVLMQIVDANPGLAPMINKKRFPTVEIWETLGKFNHLTARTEWTRQRSDGTFEARVELVDTHTGFVIGAAEAECSRSEEKWAKSLGYSLKSMAQTRAVSKAFRMNLSWIVVLAGMQPTPAEEVPRGGFKDDAPQPQEPPPKKAEPPKRTEPYPWTDERKKLRDRIFLLADKYAEIAPIKGGAFKEIMDKDETRHALMRQMYKGADGLSFMNDTQLVDLQR